jgi:hypothetical protein
MKHTTPPSSSQASGGAEPLTAWRTQQQPGATALQAQQHFPHTKQHLMITTAPPAAQQHLISFSSAGPPRWRRQHQKDTSAAGLSYIHTANPPRQQIMKWREKFGPHKTPDVLSCIHPSPAIQLLTIGWPHITPGAAGRANESPPTPLLRHQTNYNTP